jgi:hypothetical protein
MGSQMDTIVSIPARITTEKMEFDFISSLERYEEFQKMSKDQMLQMLNLTARALTLSTASDINAKVTEYLRQFGISDKDVLVDLAEKVYSKVVGSITDTFSRSGISALMYKDVFMGLSTSESDKTTGVRQISSFSTVVAGVRQVQDLYALFTNSASSAEIASFIGTHTASDPSFVYVRSLLSALYNDTKGVAFQGRLGYVLNTVHKMTHSKDLLSISSDVPGLSYLVEDMDLDGELTLPELSAGLIIMLRGLIGLDTTDGVRSVSLSEMANSSFSSLGLPPSVPADFGDIDMERVEAFMLRLWTMFVTQRVATRDFGRVDAKIQMIMDPRKYDRDDSLTAQIKELRQEASLVFDAYLDVFAFIKHLVFESGIHFDLPRKRKDVYLKYLKDTLDRLKVPTTSSSDPRFLKEPHHLIEHSVGVALVDVNFTVNDETISNIVPFRSVSPDFSTVSSSALAASEIYKGSVMDLPVDMDIQLYPLMSSFAPVYYTTMANSDMLSGYDFFRYGLGFKTLTELQEHPLSQFLMNRFDLFYISNAFEFSQRFEIPLDLANELFTTPQMYGLVRDLAFSYYFSDPRQFPIYEIVYPGGDDEMDGYIIAQEFKSLWPFMLKASTQLTVPTLRKSKKKEEGSDESDSDKGKSKGKEKEKEEEGDDAPQPDANPSSEA